MYYDSFTITDTLTNKTFTFEIIYNALENDYFVKLFNEDNTCIESNSFSILPSNKGIATFFGFEY